MTADPIKVALISQWYPPEPVRIPVAIADALRDEGFDVEVMTGVPNWPTGIVHQGFSPWRYRREEVGGHPVYRSPLYPSHNESVARRMLNYLSWAFLSIVPAVQRLGRRDVSLVYSSPATAAIPAMVGKLLFGTPYVLIIQDLWPDSVTSTGFLCGHKWAWARSALNAFVSATYRWSAHIVTISPGMEAVLTERGVPRSKISLIYNWIDGAESEDREPAGRGLERPFTVMYGGNLGPAQSLVTAIEALRLTARADIRLTVVGGGIEADRLQQLAESIVPGRVTFIEAVPHSVYVELMRSADVQLVILRNEPLFDVTMPSKVQAVLAAGYPMIASAGRDVRDVVDESGAGWAVPPGDAAALAAAFDAAAAESSDELWVRGRSARLHYEKYMSRAIGSGRLASRLRSVVRERHA